MGKRRVVSLVAVAVAAFAVVAASPAVGAPGRHRGAGPAAAVCFDGTVEVVEFERLTPELRAELEGEEEDPFDVGDTVLQFRPKERHVALRDDAGRLVASTGLLVVEVEAAGRLFGAVGFGGVIVNEHHRGQGLARRVVSEALSKARTLGPEFAILFCHDDRAGLYRKLGFASVGADVQVEQPEGYAAMPQRMMWRGLVPDAAWPPGPVLLHSLPF